VVEKPLPEDLKEYFSPPEEFAGEYGDYRSPLIFESGEEVQNASDWEQRRGEILDRWHGLLGEWPEVLTNPCCKLHRIGPAGRFHAAQG
jgi:hypothetical protein